MKPRLRSTRGQGVLAWGLLAIITACSAPHGSGNAHAASAASSTDHASTQARAFVQRFYTWYTPVANKGLQGPAWYTVLDQRPFLLSDTLLHALQTDRARQAKATGEIDGLDFDPFLAAQDPCGQYVASDSAVIMESDSAVIMEPAYGVAVYGICDNERHAHPDVIAEVARRDTSWVFVDFLYPSLLGGHLLGILDSESRSPTAK
ncbi:MAG TPA: hypothetical protein VJU82_07395 [Acidobacteriaceae bacterium]|nr:hypothetical protein [Acidobacteriaceae bacterium]